MQSANGMILLGLVFMWSRVMLAPGGVHHTGLD